MALSAINLASNRAKKVLADSRKEIEDALHRAVVSIVLGDSSDAGANSKGDAVSRRDRKPRKRAGQPPNRNADKQLELFAQSQKKVARKGYSS
jgi:hypothetical protein